MYLLKLYYRKKYPEKDVPYYAHYSIFKIIWIPFRKYINVVIIPNIPFNFLRILLYRFIGYKIGKKVFIGMKCYLDDLEPRKIRIGNNVVISYGVYFSVHGKGQNRTHIIIEDKAYIGMCVKIAGGKNGVTIGSNSIIGAGSLVLKDVPSGELHAGVPAKKIKDV
jgi:acetyltransferase-like isoleucine patch superfamily enzyme